MGRKKKQQNQNSQIVVDQPVLNIVEANTSPVVQTVEKTEDITVTEVKVVEPEPVAVEEKEVSNIDPMAKDELDEYQNKFGASFEDAVKLFQSCLSIRKSGEWDELTAVAWAEVHSKRDFINDYRNLRKVKEDDRKISEKESEDKTN